MLAEHLYQKSRLGHGQSTDATANHEQYALQGVLLHIREALEPILASFSNNGSVSANKMLSICFSQPHVGIKEIRFATWAVSMVVSTELRLGYLWSSDSDTVVPAESVVRAISLLGRSEGAGAASTALAILNREESLIARLCAVYYRSSVYIDRSVLATYGQCPVVTGPSALFRVDALKDVVVPWYRQRVLGFRTASLLFRFFLRRLCNLQQSI